MRTTELTALRPNSELRTRHSFIAGEDTALTLTHRVREQIGITRVSEIGGFLDRSIFVCQTTRPRLLYHYRLGVNTGSQGKGYNRDQAHISAVMEAAETYCAEQRTPDFVHGSYSELSKSHRIAPPESFIPECYDSHVSRNEALVWTKAIHWGSQEEVLIPAEVAHTFHIPELFGDRLIFPASSAGIAAGFDSRVTVTRSLLEIVEQHYRGATEALEVEVDWLHPVGVVGDLIAKTSPAFNSRFDTHFFAIKIKGARTQIPFTMCFIGDEDKLYVGWGLRLDPIQALESAHLEAFQSWATEISGSRENMTRKPKYGVLRLPAEVRNQFEDIWPDEPNLHPNRFIERFRKLTEHSAKAGEDSAKKIAEILAELGYRDIYLINLSRVGVDCYVTKAIVPQLKISLKVHVTPSEVKPLDWGDIAGWQFCFKKGRRRKNSFQLKGASR